MQKNRISLALLTAIVFVPLALQSTRSETAVTTPYQRPLQDDAAEMRELAHWALTGSTQTNTPKVFRPEDFDAALDPAPRRMEIFQPPAPDSESRRRVLYDIPYGSAISVYSERHGVDGLLVAAIVSVESNFSARAVSPKGAQGLMQVRPMIGKAYGSSDLFDPYANIDVGTRYLGQLIEENEGNLELALASYNAGPAAVARYGGVPPYAETRAYVRKVMARYAAYSERAGEPLGTADLGTRVSRTSL
ncbi:MAG TPA: lytic transglycosylase domain-containing protein [Thermoanaerobaculia bacterium]|nr:lytic transglycosylase domain-containing protein [Thermoanaerobaculia bacterium]